MLIMSNAELALPVGPPTTQEIWTNTIDILKQAPAAYRYTVGFSRFFGLYEGVSSLWLFHDYDPDTDRWNHIAVRGDSEQRSVPADVMRAAEHFNTSNLPLSNKEKKAGILGSQAVSLCGVTMKFPERELLFSLVDNLPDHVDQLTVQTRHGVKGQAVAGRPYDQEIVRLDNPKRDSVLDEGSGRRSTEEQHTGFSELLVANGVLEQMLPNFVRSKFTDIFPIRR
jgi:hypothetical protein